MWLTSENALRPSWRVGWQEKKIQAFSKSRSMWITAPLTLIFSPLYTLPLSGLNVCFWKASSGLYLCDRSSPYFVDWTASGELATIDLAMEMASVTTSDEGTTELTLECIYKPSDARTGRRSVSTYNPNLLWASIALMTFPVRSISAASFDYGEPEKEDSFRFG